MRDPSHRFRTFTRLPIHARDGLRASAVFRDWFALVHTHARERPRQSLTFRDGTVLHMTTCPCDCQTAFAVYAKRDYDPLPINGTVLDIGANFGAFSVRAARLGNKVVAVEPNPACFEALTANAGPDVTAIWAAVWSKSGHTLEIPTSPHPGNSVLRPGIKSVRVQTVTLADLIRGPLDYLKMDCEGAEYAILRGTSPETWRHVQTVALEYHDGPRDIPHLLTAAGFRLVKHKRQEVWGMDYGFIRAER